MKSTKNSYHEKKQYFDSFFTLYGRKPVLEALNDESLSIYRLHLASSNKPARVLEEIEALANSRGIEVLYHDKKALSRISKNAKQDQGVAADLMLPNYHALGDYIDNTAFNTNDYYILLDQVTNPQNVGMIIRSVAAGFIKGLIIPKHGTAELGPLVIKSSAGTLFKCPILRSKDSLEAVQAFKDVCADIVVLDVNAGSSLFDYHQKAAKQNNKASLFVLGNETHGVSEQIRLVASKKVNIPMNNDVESLNVAVTAALIAFLNV